MVYSVVFFNNYLKTPLCCVFMNSFWQSSVHNETKHIKQFNYNYSTFSCTFHIKFIGQYLLEIVLLPYHIDLFFFLYMVISNHNSKPPIYINLSDWLICETLLCVCVCYFFVIFDWLFQSINKYKFFIYINDIHTHICQRKFFLSFIVFVVILFFRSFSSHLLC